MNAYIAFTKKEFRECVRTHKLLILMAVFLLLGMMNPIVAKIMPDMVDSLLPEGIQITLSEPSAMDSWMQFFKNIPQTGLIVLVIVFAGMISGELSRGTLVNLLTKGLSRGTVILSKLTMSVSVFSASYILCTAVSWGYTSYFWPGQTLPNLLFSIACLWLFGVMLLTSLLFGGVVFSGNYSSLLFTAGFVMLLFIAEIVPVLKPFDPVRLASENMGLLTDGLTAADFVPAILSACGLSLGFTTGAIALFRKKQV